VLDIPAFDPGHPVLADVQRPGPGIDGPVQGPPPGRRPGRDFNALPGSDTNRYLNGQGAGADGGYTYWTEAFAVVGNPDEATTVAAGNPWARKTAHGVGIQFPEMFPDRRIDYVWTYDWAYAVPAVRSP
jgi:hypothetical protein